MKEEHWKSIMCESPGLSATIPGLKQDGYAENYEKISWSSARKIEEMELKPISFCEDLDRIDELLSEINRRQNTTCQAIELPREAFHTRPLSAPEELARTTK